jgi:hypothetical protein
MVPQTFAVDPATWEIRARGVNTVPGTFADQFTSEPTLLYFLRHFG